jgi:hypothetical protein
MFVNFVRTKSKNYAKVQEQTLGMIKAALPAGHCLESIGVRREGCLNFTLFIHQPADVVLSHGVADKNYFFRKDKNGERIASRLSHVLVPGEWLRKRLIGSKKLGLSGEQVHVVGWPRLDTLIARQTQLDSEPTIPRRKRVLWAPTHDYARRGQEQVSLSSYPEFEPYVQQLQTEFDVQVALHPRNRRDKVPTNEKLLWADYVISDFGTMVYEAWALGKLVIFPGWIIRDRILEFLPAGCAESVIFRQGIGLHATSFGELRAFIHAAQAIDPIVYAFMDNYLAREYRGTSSQRVADVLLRLAATTP